VRGQSIKLGLEEKALEEPFVKYQIRNELSGARIWPFPEEGLLEKLDEEFDREGNVG